MSVVQIEVVPRWMRSPFQPFQPLLEHRCGKDVPAPGTVQVPEMHDAGAAAALGGQVGFHFFPTVHAGRVQVVAAGGTVSVSLMSPLADFAFARMAVAPRGSRRAAGVGVCRRARREEPRADDVLEVEGVAVFYFTCAGTRLPQRGKQGVVPDTANGCS